MVLEPALRAGPVEGSWDSGMMDPEAFAYPSFLFAAEPSSMVGVSGPSPGSTEFREDNYLTTSQKLTWRGAGQSANSRCLQTADEGAQWDSPLSPYGSWGPNSGNQA